MTDDPGSRRVEIAVNCQAGAWQSALPGCEALARQAISAALGHGSPAIPAGRTLEVSLLLADDAVLQQLNRDYRGRDKATNVLAFPSFSHSDDLTAVRAAVWAADLAPELAQGQPLVLGDIALAWETLAREAGEQGKSPVAHFMHLLVHGTLHLLGYDHETEEEAEEMEGLERETLGSLGIEDPYQGSGTAAGRRTEATSVG